MTNFWDNTPAYEPKNSYGQKEFDKFLETHDLYLVDFDDRFIHNFIPLANFKFPNLENYEDMRDNYDYSGTWEEYINESNEIYSSLIKYDTSIFKLRNQNLFRTKEYGQIMVMIGDIYSIGPKNYPSSRVEHDALSSQFVSHPGQHLLWIRNFLGYSNTVWLSLRKDFKNIRPKIFNEHNRVCEITNTQQIIDILGTENINGWIQNWWSSGVQSVSIYPMIEQNGWNKFNDDNGHTSMPWDRASEFRYSDDSSVMPWCEWMDEILESKYPIEKIEQHIEIKTDFPSIRLTLNNLLAFMLTRKQEDKNFKFKYT